MTTAAKTSSYKTLQNPETKKNTKNQRMKAPSRRELQKEIFS